MAGKDKNKSFEGEDRRRYVRISKNYILTYFDVKNPEDRFELTQLRNISRGGICFVTSRPFASGTKLAIDLKTPYISETTHLEGIILESHEKVKNIIYETRLEYTSLNPDAEYMINKLIEFYENDQGASNE